MEKKRFEQKTSEMARRWLKRANRAEKWWAKKSEWLEGLFVFLATFTWGAWHFVATFRMGSLKCLSKVLFGLATLIVPLVLLILLGIPMESGLEKILLLVLPGSVLLGIGLAIIFLSRADRLESEREQDSDEATSASLMGKWELVKVALVSYSLVFISYALYFRNHVPEKAFFVSSAYSVYLKAVSAIQRKSGNLDAAAPVTRSEPPQERTIHASSGKRVVVLRSNQNGNPLVYIVVDSVCLKRDLLLCFVKFERSEEGSMIRYNWHVYLLDSAGAKYQLTGADGIGVGSIGNKAFIPVEPRCKVQGTLMFGLDTNRPGVKPSRLDMVLADVVGGQACRFQLPFPLSLGSEKVATI